MKPEKIPESVSFVLTLVSILVLMFWLYYVERTDLPYRQFYRYISIAPVAFVSYRFGLRPGLLIAVFFSSAFVPQLHVALQGDWLSPQTIQLIAFILFINTLAYITADISNSIRAHEALSSTVRDWGKLMEKTSALDEVIAFLLEQSNSICKTESAVFFLRNPLDAQWEIITSEGKTPLPSSESSHKDRQNLAEWLLEQDRSFFLNNLDKPNSFILQHTNTSENQLRSLLVQPLSHTDGTLMGLLILINKVQGEFSKSDFQAIRDLITGGERALEQAGLYARTDYALAHRVRQLAAIQRTARELNATLDPKQIIERTLECALEITDGEAGLISLNMAGFPPLFQTQGARLQTFSDPTLFTGTQEALQAAILPSGEDRLPSLLTQASSRLFVPIKRGDQTFGLVIVESSSPRIFKEASRHVLTTLVDHAAIALENARLFQEIQTEQQRVSLIIHSIADGLFTTDLNGRIVTFNPAAERLTGWPTSLCIGRSCCDVFGCQDYENDEHDCVLLQAWRDQEYATDEKFVIRQRSGTKRVISLSTAPLPATNGLPEGSVFLFRDITEEEEMERLQRELIAAISHELRSPLSNISTITETLMGEADELAAQPYHKHLNTLKAQTQRLADFSDRILDIYRFETGQLKLQLRPLPVCLLVESLVNQWQIAAPRYDFVTYLPTKSPWIWADENAFQSLLNNLIDNAVKYSPQGTRIEIHVETSLEGFVKCWVQDQGPGIAPEYQPRVFERFYRVDGGDSQLVYGHGLGLYISRNLVYEMGGQIWVESEIGKGSRFTFCLPVMEENNEAEDFSD